MKRPQSGLICLLGEFLHVSWLKHENYVSCPTPKHIICPRPKYKRGNSLCFSKTLQLFLNLRQWVFTLPPYQNALGSFTKHTDTWIHPQRFWFNWTRTWPGKQVFFLSVKQPEIVRNSGCTLFIIPYVFLHFTPYAWSSKQYCLKLYANCTECTISKLIFSLTLF